MAKRRTNQEWRTLLGESDEKRKAEGQLHAKPILDELYEWMTSQQVIESSPQGKATKYRLGQWLKLIRYIDDGHLSIDNNRAERELNRWSFAGRTGCSRTHQMALMRARCFAVSSKQRKQTALSYTIT